MTSDPRRRALLAASLLLLVLLVGAVGYTILGLSPIDAIYQTAITITTVGFGEISPNPEPSEAYRLFTLALVLTGATTVAFSVGVFVDAIIESRLGPYQERKMQREIEKLEGHLIVCGFGRVGGAVVERAEALGDDVVVIDSRSDRFDNGSHLHIVGDATNDTVLRRAGIERAGSLVAALASDSDNLFVAVSARQLNPDLRIVSRANSSDTAQKLRVLDIDTVVEPYQMAGARLATAALRPNTSDYLDQVFSSESDKVELTELLVQPSSAMVGWDAKRAEDTCGIVVVAVRPEGETDFLSSGAHEDGFGAGDVLIVLGDRAGVTKLAEFATS